MQLHIMHRQRPVSNDGIFEIRFPWRESRLQHQQQRAWYFACTVLTTNFEGANISFIACTYFIVSKERETCFMAYVPVATCNQE
jgi:hypothetical protein